jgi:RNA polymerase sigma factor (sigma-70 family)
MTMSAESRAVDDAALLERFVSSKDQQAFRALVQRYHRLVYSVCYRGLSRNAAAADDAAQAVFILMSRKARRIEARALSSWLFKTAVQVTHTLRRAEQRRKKRESAMARNSEPVPSPAVTMEQLQRDHALYAQVLKLPAKQREAIILYYYAGLDQAQVAQRLESTPKAIQKRIEYGLATLRAKLGSRTTFSSLGVALLALEQARDIQLPAGLAARCHGAAVAPAKHQAAVRLADEVLRQALIGKTVVAAGAGTLAILLAVAVYAYPNHAPPVAAPIVQQAGPPRQVATPAAPAAPAPEPPAAPPESPLPAIQPALEPAPEIVEKPTGFAALEEPPPPPPDPMNAPAEAPAKAPPADAAPAPARPPLKIQYQPTNGPGGYGPWRTATRSAPPGVKLAPVATQPAPPEKAP